MQSCREYEISECSQASTELGRPLPSDCYGRSGHVLPRRLEGKALTLIVECSKLEKVLSVNVICLKN